MSTTSEDSDSDFLELSSLHSSDGLNDLGMYDTSVKPFESHQTMMFVTVGVYDHILDHQKESAQINIDSKVSTKKCKKQPLTDNTSIDYYSRLPLNETILSTYNTSNTQQHPQAYDPLKTSNIAILTPSLHTKDTQSYYNFPSNPNNISIEIPSSSNTITAYNTDTTLTTGNSTFTSLMATVTDNERYEESGFCMGSYGNRSSNDESFSDNPDVVAMMHKNRIYDSDDFPNYFADNSSTASNSNQLILDIDGSSMLSDDIEDIYDSPSHKSSTHKKQKYKQIEKRHKKQIHKIPLILSRTSDCSISLKLDINHLSSNKTLDINMTPSPSSNPPIIKGKYLIEQNSNHGRYGKKNRLNDAYMEGNNELVVFGDVYNSRIMHHVRTGTLPVLHHDIQSPVNRCISCLNPKLYDICIVIAKPLKIFYECMTRQQSTNHRISIRYDVQHLIREPLEYLQSGLPDRSEVFDCLQQAFTRTNLKMRSANFIGTREKLSMIDNGGGCKILQFVGYACHPILDCDKFSELASTIHVHKNESHILLEDDTNAYWFGEGRWISQSELGKKLQPSKYDIVIAMSPQHTRMAQIFTELGFKYVLAIETAGYELRFCESKTATFLRLFYSAILNQQSIRRSFDLALAGTNGVLLGKKQQTYILYTPRDLIHSSYIVFKQLMSAAPETHHSSVQYPTEKTNIINAVRPFIGRASQVIKILQLLSKGKILVVKGCELIGRSTIIQVVCRYLLQHGFFTGGCFVIDCKRISNHNRKHCNFSEVVFKTLKENGMDFSTKVIPMVIDSSDQMMYNNTSVDIQLSRIPEGRPPTAEGIVKNRYQRNDDSGDSIFSTYSSDSTDQIKIFEENGELQLKTKNYSSISTVSSSDLPMNFQKHSRSLLEVLDDILGHQSLCMIILNPSYWPKTQQVNEFITYFNDIMSDESRCMIAMDPNAYTTQLWDDMGVITLSSLSPFNLAKIFCKFVNCGRRNKLYSETEILENVELQMIFDGRPGVVAKCASFVKMFMSETGIPTIKKIIEEFPKCNSAKNIRIRIINNCSSISNNSQFSSTSSSSFKLCSSASFNSSSEMNTNGQQSIDDDEYISLQPIHHHLQNISENEVVHHHAQFNAQPFRYSTIQYDPINKPSAINVCMPPSVDECNRYPFLNTTPHPSTNKRNAANGKRKKKVAILSSIPSEHSMYGNSSPAVKHTHEHPSHIKIGSGVALFDCQSPAYHKNISSMNSSESIEWENSVLHMPRQYFIHIAADTSISTNGIGNQSSGSTVIGSNSVSSSGMNYLQNINALSSSSPGSWSMTDDSRTQLVMNHSYQHSYQHSFQNSYPLMLSPVRSNTPNQQQFFLALFPTGVPNFQCDQSVERQHIRSNLSSMGHSQSIIGEHHQNNSISYRRKKVKQLKFAKHKRNVGSCSISYPPITDNDEDDDVYTPSTSLSNKNTTFFNKSISLMNINSGGMIPFDEDMVVAGAVLDDDGHTPKHNSQKPLRMQRHHDGQHLDLHFNQSLKDINSITNQQRLSITDYKACHSRRVSAYNIAQSKTSTIATLLPPSNMDYNNNHIINSSFECSTNMDLVVEAVVECEVRDEKREEKCNLPSLHNSYSDNHPKHVTLSLLKTHSECKTNSTRVNKRMTLYSHACRIWNKSRNFDGMCYLKNLFSHLLTFFKNETLCKYQFPRMIDLEHFFLLMGGEFGSEINDAFENIPLIKMEKFIVFFLWFQGICDIVYDLKNTYDINNGQKQMECLFYGCSRVEEILKTRPIGTFILRLESQTNILCVSVKKRLLGKKSKICHLYFERKSKDKYLRNGKQYCVQILYFIRYCKLLKFFYTPLKLFKKSEIFCG